MTVEQLKNEEVVFSDVDEITDATMMSFDNTENLTLKIFGNIEENKIGPTLDMIYKLFDKTPVLISEENEKPGKTKKRTGTIKGIFPPEKYYIMQKKVEYTRSQEQKGLKFTITRYADSGLTNFEGTTTVNIPIGGGAATAHYSQPDKGHKTYVVRTNSQIESNDVNDFIENTSLNIPADENKKWERVE